MEWVLVYATTLLAGYKFYQLYLDVKKHPQNPNELEVFEHRITELEGIRSEHLEAQNAIQELTKRVKELEEQRSREALQKIRK